jgi:hypothetical protein
MRILRGQKIVKGNGPLIGFFQQPDKYPIIPSRHIYAGINSCINQEEQWEYGYNQTENVPGDCQCAADYFFIHV